METHEVVRVIIDDEEHEIIRLRQKHVTAKANKNTSSSTRGWDGFSTITVLEGRGAGSIWIWLGFISIFFCLYIMPADSIVGKTGPIRTLAQIGFGLICTFALYAVTVGRTSIRISSVGFHVNVLWRRIFVPWNGCGEFRSYTFHSRKGIFMKDEEMTRVAYSHEQFKIPPDVNLLGTLSYEIVGVMNSYRERFQKNQ